MEGRPQVVREVDGTTHAEEPNERTALLHGPLKNITRSATPVHEEDCDGLNWSSQLLALTRLTLPMWITNLLEYSITGTTVAVVGHLGAEELAGASLAILLVGTTILSVFILGITGALDTLATQAYTSQNPKTTSLYVQRTGVLLVVGLVPTCTALCFSEHFLVMIGQKVHIAHLAGQYLRIYICGVPFLAGFELCRRWLQAQGLVAIPTLVVAVVAPISTLISWTLVLGPDTMRLGFIGAPIATVISHALSFAVIAVYCIFYAPRDAWGGWTTAAFRDLGPNIELGLPAVVLKTSMWWSWDVMAFASSHLGTYAFDANQVTHTLAVFLYRLPNAFVAAIAIRVGNALGEGKAMAAHQIAKVASWMDVTLGILQCILICACRERLARMFTDDKQVLYLVQTIMPHLAVYQIGNIITGSTVGVFRATGLAFQAARINFVAFWLVATPTALVLTFVFRYGLAGLWMSPVLSLGLTAIWTSMVVYRIDWLQMAKQARTRADKTDALLKSLREGGTEDASSD